MQSDRTSRWSRYLIFFILAVLPLERIPSLDITHPISATIRLSQVAGLILLVINIPFLWQRRGTLLRGPWRWLVAFWLVCIISTGLATDLKRGVTVTLFTIFVGLMSWIIALRFERDQIRNYVKIITISALVTCAFGIYQFFGDLLGLSTNLTGLRPQYTKAVFGFPRIQSTALEPLYFGDYLLIPAALLSTVMVTIRRKYLAALAMLPVLTIVWLSVSRGAIVALAGVLILSIIFAAWRRSFQSIGWIIGSVIVSIGLAYGLLIIGSYTAPAKGGQTSHAVDNFSKQATNISNGESAEGRTLTRKIAINGFKSSPLLGIGPGNFGSYAAKARPDHFSGNKTIVNNEPLEIAAETGILGILSLGLFIIAIFWRVGKLILFRTKSDPLLLASTIGLGIAIVGIGAQYMTFSTLYITHVWVTLGLLMGAILAQAKPSKKDAARRG